MEVDWDRVIVAGLTLGQLLAGAGVLVALFVGWKILRSLFAREEADKHLQQARCRACGWQGQVSRYAGRCPQCNRPLGEQKARK